MAGNGAGRDGVGIGIHLYAANRDMHGRFFYDADGELLIVPQQGGCASRPNWACSTSSRRRSR
jgi:homogentisate 1,2-dioxygenase